MLVFCPVITWIPRSKKAGSEVEKADCLKVLIEKGLRISLEAELVDNKEVMLKQDDLRYVKNGKVFLWPV